MYIFTVAHTHMLKMTDESEAIAGSLNYQYIVITLAIELHPKLSESDKKKVCQHSIYR